jgi:hypothetical protein
VRAGERLRFREPADDGRLPGALQARLLWLLVPAVGLLELGAQAWVSNRAPDIDAWRAVAPAVVSLKRAGEPLVVAPEWAEPIARHAFGDAAFPVAELARSDLGGYRRVLELSLLGARSDEAREFRVVEERRSGPFTLRVLENPKPRVAVYRLLEHVTPEELEVAIVEGGVERPCAYSTTARVVTGGLHGEVTFPRERFVCGGRDSAFVGITIIDDQRYRPRRCLWAQPPHEGQLRLRFSRVPAGRVLQGFGGLSYFLFRDGGREPIRLSARFGEQPFGSYLHRDEWGFHAFRLSGLPPAPGATVPLELVVQSERAESRDFCFTLEVVP